MTNEQRSDCRLQTFRETRRDCEACPELPIEIAEPALERPGEILRCAQNDRSEGSDSQRHVGVVGLLAMTNRRGVAIADCRMQNRIGHFAFCTLHFALCTALIVLALLVGGRCGRVRTKEPLIDGFLFKEAYVGYPTSYDRWIEVYDEDGLPQIPTATYNGQQLEMISWNPNHTIYEDTSAFKSDTTCDMEVEHYWGRAWLRLNMPADFRITQPDSSYVFDRDSGLTVSWQKSRGATWYWLVIYLAYDFTDTLGGQGYYQFVKDTILSDTVCVFEPNRFFPPLVRDVLRGEGQAVMWSADGPQTTIGAANNVQGHGYGYVSAANQPEEAYFTVAHPPTTPMDRTEPGRRARESFVRRLRQMTGISDTTRSPGRRRP